MRKHSVVFSEGRYKMPLVARNTIKTTWINCLEKKGVSRPHKFTQLVDFLLSEADSNGVIFTTLMEIEEKANISYRTISKTLTLLEKYKLIEKRNGIVLIKQPTN